MPSTMEILKALVTIFGACENQKNCNECILKGVCGKMFCEW